jgi:hypothetical protein
MRIGCWMNKVRLRCTDDPLVLTRAHRARAGRAHRRVQESRHPVSSAEWGSGSCGHRAFRRAVSSSPSICSPTAAEHRSGTCSTSSVSRTPILSRLSTCSVSPLGHFLYPRHSHSCISSYTPLLPSAFSRPASRASTSCVLSSDTTSLRCSRRAIVYWLLRRLRLRCSVLSRDAARLPRSGGACPAPSWGLLSLWNAGMLKVNGAFVNSKNCNTWPRAHRTASRSCIKTDALPVSQTSQAFGKRLTLHPVGNGSVHRFQLLAVDRFQSLTSFPVKALNMMVQPMYMKLICDADFTLDTRR